MEWVDVCASSELFEGQLRPATALGRELVLLRFEGVAYALDGRCPHRGGELWKGDLVAGRLACPLHAWTYDVKTGVAFFPQGTKLPVHRVVEEDGRVKVQLSTADLSGFTPPRF